MKKMTNKLNKVEGNNIFCGPAAIAAITGHTTDDVERLIQKLRANYSPVKAVYDTELYKIFNQLGWKVNTQSIAKGTRLFSFISEMREDGYYVISVPSHFVVVYKEGNNRFFCDNHTKEPIRAGASARLMQEVVRAARVEKIKEEEVKVDPIGLERAVWLQNEINKIDREIERLACVAVNYHDELDKIREKNNGNSR